MVKSPPIYIPFKRDDPLIAFQYFLKYMEKHSDEYEGLSREYRSLISISIALLVGSRIM